MIKGFWPGNALLQKPGKSLWLLESVPESVTGNGLHRHQWHSELRPNDSVLIQKDKPIRNSGFQCLTTEGVTKEQFTK